MKISDNGLRMLKAFESFSSKPYMDHVGVWTIGYGSTFYQDGRKVSKTDAAISEQQASDLLLAIFEKNFAPHLPANLNQNQYDALACFIYNVGASNFNKSTLKRKVLENNAEASIEEEFLKWNKGTVNGRKVVIAGLTNRRAKEAALYFTPL